ncbi:hypothetical protein [Pseudoxanthomonas sp. JBR18]|uniref:hypothetical protein n=1 Tax=Pseudoxanthomonas sp. JBR18 TaxID=2969308 RepID=UPI0023055426|nr:hypothetical protein [Pseudoxanthomonas sp. JBR18]WCE05825.1 hypothetical protein PJ250_07720 [Pseudoxanthomonas sp. JBR18]
MTAKKHTARVALQQASATLITEVVIGKWSHVPGLSGEPIEQWAEVLAKLEKLCPGQTKDEYIAALARAIRDNR